MKLKESDDEIINGDSDIDKDYGQGSDKSAIDFNIKIEVLHDFSHILQVDLWTSWSVSVWEVAADGQDANVTLTQLPHVVDQARRLRQVSWCVTVVVVSDDLAFLAAFAQWSLKGRLVGPATRLLAVTNASLVNNPDLSRTYSKMNAVMLVVEDYQESRQCGVYLHLPYSPRGAQALKVASWTPHQGLALTSSLPLFPDKFSKNRLNLHIGMQGVAEHEKWDNNVAGLN
nr:uncharacterized protein LOC123755103 [Procambarus clarkii]